jgi:hypothetical protein
MNRQKPSIRDRSLSTARSNSISKAEQAAIRARNDLDVSHRQLSGDVNFSAAMKKLGFVFQWTK